jgi:hypothetical protein
VIVCEDAVPEGYVEVDTYHPCPTVTPWDYYGGKHQREISLVLRAADIPHILLRTTERLKHPVGTGPRGSVRFGDDMMPGVFRVAVPNQYESRAHGAILAHKSRVAEWLKNPSMPMPAACQG